jgi:hypothetical protein
VKGIQNYLFVRIVELRNEWKITVANAKQGDKQEFEQV